MAEKITTPEHPVVAEFRTYVEFASIGNDKETSQMLKDMLKEYERVREVESDLRYELAKAKETVRSVPVTPDNVVDHKLANIPKEVIDAFNKRISISLYDGISIVYLKDIREDIIRSLPENEEFKNEYLNVEDIYRNAGWNVEFQKPSYQEDWLPRYIFSIEKW